MDRREFLVGASVVAIGGPLSSGCLDSSAPGASDDGSTGDDGPESTDENANRDGTEERSDDERRDIGGDATEWTHEVGGSVDAVAHGYVFGREYFGDEDGDGGVFALDVETGDHEWTYGQTGGLTMYTPLAVEDALYFGFGTDAIGDGSGDLYALEYDGDERWTRETGSVYDRPIVDDSVVYAGSDDGAVRAFETTDGTVRWSNDELGGEHSADLSVVAVTDAVLVAIGRLVALDRDDGDVLWRYGDRDSRIRDATVIDDVAYLTDRDGLVAVDVEGDSADERWRVDFEHTRWIKGIEAGRAFVEHQYDIHAFALEDGADLWVMENDDRAVVDFYGDRAYVGTDRLSALDAEDGSEHWSVLVGDDEPIQSVWAVPNGNAGTESAGDAGDHSIFVQTDDTRLSRVDPDGEITWTDTVDGRIGSLVVRDGFAFVGTMEGIYSLSLGTGTKTKSE